MCCNIVRACFRTKVRARVCECSQAYCRKGDMRVLVLTIIKCWYLPLEGVGVYHIKVDVFHNYEGAGVYHYQWRVLVFTIEGADVYHGRVLTFTIEGC